VFRVKGDHMSDDTVAEVFEDILGEFTWKDPRNGPLDMDGIAEGTFAEYSVHVYDEPKYVWAACVWRMSDIGWDLVAEEGGTADTIDEAKARAILQVAKWEHAERENEKYLDSIMSQEDV
jgi:hypothetical protein